MVLGPIRGDIGTEHHLFGLVCLRCQRLWRCLLDGTVWHAASNWVQTLSLLAIDVATSLVVDVRRRILVSLTKDLVVVQRQNTNKLDPVV